MHGTKPIDVKSKNYLIVVLLVLFHDLRAAEEAEDR